MEPVARALRLTGFSVLNVALPTRKLDIAGLSDHLDEASRGWRAERAGPLHLVGHSLGGLVARAWITRHTPRRIGRVVLLGPPSAGSEIADRLAPSRLFSRFFGPAALQLTTRYRAHDRTLGPVHYPLGIIAGTRAMDPVGWLVLPKPNDGKVTVARTHVDGAADHLTLPVTHTLMMRDPRVIAATCHFLQHGRFEPLTTCGRART